MGLSVLWPPIAEKKKQAACLLRDKLQEQEVAKCELGLVPCEAPPKNPTTEGSQVKRNSDPWFRFYVRTLNNPKAQRLPGVAFKFWINLLCLAKETDGSLPPIEDIAFRLRLSKPKAEALLKSLRLKGLIDENRMHDWDELQYQSDSSTARVKQHRKRSKEHPGNVSSNVSVTVQSRTEENRVETETETDLKPLPPLIAPRLCSPRMKHAWCDGRMHVPLSLHHEFQRLAPDGLDLMDWYGETELRYADTPIGDDAFVFWRARWREKYGTTKQQHTETSYEDRVAELEDISRGMKK